MTTAYARRRRAIAALRKLCDRHGTVLDEVIPGFSKRLRKAERELANDAERRGGRPRMDDEDLWWIMGGVDYHRFIGEELSAEAACEKWAAELADEFPDDKPVKGSTLLRQYYRALKLFPDGIPPWGPEPDDLE
jgi:hypothetical protein